MNLCNESCSSVLHPKTRTLDIYTQTVKPNLFIPAMPIGIIDFYHSILLSLTLPGGNKVSAKQNVLASFSHSFHLIRIKFDVVMKQF